MSQSDEYESEVTAGREEIAAILSGVADGIRTGAVRLGDDTDAVAVDTPDELTLEIELETEDDEVSLELELEWPVSSDSAPVSSVEGTPEETELEWPVSSDSAPVSSVEGTPEDTDEGSTLVGAADGSQSLARFEVYQARDEEWRWRLRHRNGNIIATSGEGYTRKHNALKGLRSVMANSADAAITGEFTD